MNRKKATLTGLIAVILWSSIVGLIRGVSESLGATGGAALIYTVGAFFLLLSVGFPKLSAFPRRYLAWGGLLFVSYELCLSLSIGYADNGRQAIEVGMVNYLWPTFTMVSAILFNKHRANFLIVPGFLLSMIGICWVLGGAMRFNPQAIAYLVLAGASYFIPVISAALAAKPLGATPGGSSSDAPWHGCDAAPARGDAG